MAIGLDDPTMFGPTGVGPPNQTQVEALNNILAWGGGALALGAGARGLSGLGSFLNRNLGGGVQTPQRQSFVRIPVPVKVKTREERDAMLAAAQEQEKEAGFAKLAASATQTMADWMGLLRRPNEIPGALHNAFAGWNQADMLNKPWVLPTGAAAIGGGLYGGWKLTDYLLDKTKDVEQESELEEARKDYENALAGRRKVAAANAAPKALDALADLYEKRGGWWDQLKGTGLLLGGGIALGSGLGAYNWTRSLAEDKAVEEAVKRRQSQITEQAPSPVMAIPTPVPIYSPPKPHLHHLRHLFGHAPAKHKEKTATIGQAADQFLSRIKNNQMAVWQRLMTPTDGKPAKPAAPAEPAPPQLPTLAGTRTRMMGQQPT
jgi:hypothetical protein